MLALVGGTQAQVEVWALAWAWVAQASCGSGKKSGGSHGLYESDQAQAAA